MRAGLTAFSNTKIRNVLAPIDFLFVLKYFYKLKKYFLDEECCEFEIVSCDQKSWEFSASSVEERDAWVSVIEREIERCLQQKLSLKDQQQLSGLFLIKKNFFQFYKKFRPKKRPKW